MVKSKPSMTASSAMVSTSAGKYPKSMESLLDEKGHVSLTPDDYDGYTEDDVTAFFASRDYEVMWVTDEKGKVWHVASDWEPNTVENADRNNMTRDRAWELIRSDFDNGGARMVHHHNHPFSTDPSDGTIEIFSPGDLGYYEDKASTYPKDGHNKPYFNVYKVHTKQGDTFTMRYDYPGTSELSRFRNDYNATMQEAFNRARKRARDGSIPYNNRACSEHVTELMVDWLRTDASSYGIEFETSWRKRG